mgnify:CR=1 FL=1
MPDAIQRLADIRARARRDFDRAAAPLRQADDALLLDTTSLDVAAAIAAALDCISTKMADYGAGQRRS